MLVKILGNGGAVCDGLPYNSFLIGGYFLAETPPDVINSLFRESVDISELRVIFISHFHADHYFGFPLLALRLFFNRIDNKIRLIGPHGLKSKIEEICRTAFGADHPYIKWVEDHILFFEIGPNEKFELNKNLVLETIPMFHFTEALGFSLYENGRIIFSYFADTLWNDNLLEVIKQKPGVILTDLNGEIDDPAPIHISEADLIKNALPCCDNTTAFYGTHLKKQKDSIQERIKYVRPGEIIKIG